MYFKCADKSSQGKMKLFKNRMGVDGFLICSKSNGIYRWKTVDGEILELKQNSV